MKVEKQMLSLVFSGRSGIFAAVPAFEISILKVFDFSSITETFGEKMEKPGHFQGFGSLAAEVWSIFKLVPTIKREGSFEEKSKLVIDNPASTARSRLPPELRGLALSDGLCSLATLNLKQIQDFLY